MKFRLVRFYIYCNEAVRKARALHYSYIAKIQDVIR